MPDMDRSGRLELPFILPAQAQKHVTHNEAIQKLDAIVQLSVSGFGLSEPPQAPAEGDVYVVGAAPTGDWEGREGRLACRLSTGWQFVLPKEGWIACDIASGGLRVFTNGLWRPLLQDVDLLGIGADADVENRLSVSSNSTLFSHSGSDHRLKVNKAATPDTASLLFQSGWSGRAEMGLAGNDAFSIKVSEDGTNFLTALAVNPTNGSLSGAAITQNSTDPTLGRLMKVSDFGVGGTNAFDSSSDLNTLGDYGGFISYTSSSNVPGNNPTAGGCAGFQSVSAGHRASQFMVLSQGARTRNRAFIRGKDTTWASWNELYHNGNILGTVSQSGGSPTGAVMESGSNANGDYVRFASGNQICFHTVTASSTAGTIWTFPAAFSGTPRISGSTVATVLSAIQLDAAPSSTAATLSARNKADARRADAMHLIAIGRWF